jgi:hypothetical protein
MKEVIVLPPPVSNLYSQGSRFIPVNPDTKAPARIDGQYIGVTQATRDMVLIDRWLTSGFGIGCVGGELDGDSRHLVIIDVDVNRSKNGNDTLARLEEDYGKLPQTQIIRTPSGGRHIYLFAKEPITCVNNAFRNMYGEDSGIDIKSHHGYCVCISNRGYELIDESLIANMSEDWEMMLRSLIPTQSKTADTYSIPPEPEIVTEFNKAHDIREVLGWYKYKQMGHNVFKHPFGGTSDRNVVLYPRTDLLKHGAKYTSYHHGAHDKIQKGPHDAFDIFRLLEHDGNWNAALNDPRSQNQIVMDNTDDGTLMGVPWENWNVYIGNDVYESEPLVIIEEHIRCGDVHMLAGVSEALKTFTAMDMAFSLATELPYLNHFPVWKGNVQSLLVLTESQDDYNDRLNAWLRYRSEVSGRDIHELRELIRNVAVCFMPFMIQEKVSIKRYEKELDRALARANIKSFSPRLLVLDHLSNNFKGDENSNPELSAFMKLWGQRAKTEDMAVVILHHPPKGGASKMRGASAIHYNNRTVFSYDNEKINEVNKIVVTRNKCSYEKRSPKYSLMPLVVENLRFYSRRPTPQMKHGLVVVWEKYDNNLIEMAVGNEDAKMIVSKGDAKMANYIEIWHNKIADKEVCLLDAARIWKVSAPTARGILYNMMAEGLITKRADNSSTHHNPPHLYKRVPPNNEEK